jgi:nucleoside-diphosphate-sugar epimerase
VSSVAIIDATHTMTERSQIQPISEGDSPYVKSKRASYYEGMHRACRGDNIAFLFPGAIYGPSPNMDRALVATSFNGAMLKGVRGELAEYAAFPFNWVFVDDVALIALAAIDEESVGERYIAAGRSEDEMPLALFCNKAANMVRSPHRVVNRPLAAVAASLGYMAATAARVYATPYIDAHVTRERLGISVTTLEDGLHVTLEWLRTAGRLQD